MSNLNKITLLIGALGLGFSGAVLSASEDTVTEYFEDSNDFEEVATLSKGGWGWSSAMAACQYGDTNCDTTIGEPIPVEPGSVKDIFIKYQQNSDNVTLNWPSTYKGDGTNFRYEVYEEPQGGSLRRIYYGTGLSTSYSAGSDKTLRYAVKACSSAGCSDLEYSEYIIVDPVYDDGGLTSKSLQQVNTEVKASSGLHKTSQPNTAAALLGKGFEALKGEYLSSGCWVASGTNTIDSSEYINEQSFSFSQVDTYESLARSLDLKREVGLNLSFSGFSIGGSHNQEVFSKTEKVTETSVIVAAFTDKQYKHNAKQASVLQMQNDKVSYLENGHKKPFRTACGDKYVDSVTTGRNMYFTIRMKKESETSSELKTKTLQLKASLESYGADGNYDSTERNEINSEYQSYSFEIFGTQAGADEASNLLILTDIDQFMTALANFATSSDESMKNIATTERDYPLPDSMLGQPHFDVFADYTVYRDKLAVWSHLDEQLLQRCWMYDSNNIETETVMDFQEALDTAAYNNNESEQNLCGAVKTMVTQKINYCLNQGNWAQCYQPLESGCIDSINGTQCMVRPDRITYKSPVKVEKRLDVARGGCAIGKCYESKRIEACFTNQDAVPDFSRDDVISDSYIPTPVKGLVTVVDKAWNVDRVTNSVFKNASGNYCLSSDAKIYGQGGWGSGGRYESNNVMWGFYPRSLNYSL